MVERSRNGWHEATRVNYRRLRMDFGIGRVTMAAIDHKNEVRVIGHDNEGVDRNVRIVRIQSLQFRVRDFTRR